MPTFVKQSRERRTEQVAAGEGFGTAWWTMTSDFMEVDATAKLSEFRARDPLLSHEDVIWTSTTEAPASQGDYLAKLLILSRYVESKERPFDEGVWRQLRNATAHLLIKPADRAENLEERYRLRDRERVLRFLAESPTLIDLLEEATLHLQAFFPDAEFVIEVVDDPEASSSRIAVAYIRTAERPEVALERLARLDNAWWLGAMSRADGKLCFNLEFE